MGGERQAERQGEIHYNQLMVEWDELKIARGGFQNANHERRNYGDQAARRQPTTATVYPGIVMDRDIEERRLSIATAKRCDNQLRTKANDVRCGGGERSKAAGHPSNGDGNDSNDDGNDNAN